jgi:hypothetical protein
MGIKLPAGKAVAVVVGVLAVGVSGVVVEASATRSADPSVWAQGARDQLEAVTGQQHQQGEVKDDSRDHPATGARQKHHDDHPATGARQNHDDQDKDDKAGPEDGARAKKDDKTKNEVEDKNDAAGKDDDKAKVAAEDKGHDKPKGPQKPPAKDKEHEKD